MPCIIGGPPIVCGGALMRRYAVAGIFSVGFARLPRFFGLGVSFYRSAEKRRTDVLDAGCRNI